MSTDEELQDEAIEEKIRLARERYQWCARCGKSVRACRCGGLQILMDGMEPVEEPE